MLAQPGDVVLVGPGTYTGDVRLRAGVTLRGAGARQTVLVAASELALRADNLRGARVQQVRGWV